MVKTYVTARPLQLNGRWITPKHLLANSFTGMALAFNQLVWSPQSDGRMLVELVTDTDGEMDAVVEAMMWFGAHQKTLGSAKAFAEAVSGQAWTVTGDLAATRCGEADGVFQASAP